MYKQRTIYAVFPVYIPIRGVHKCKRGGDKLTAQNAPPPFFSPLENEIVLDLWGVVQKDSIWFEHYPYSQYTWCFIRSGVPL